MHGTCRRVWKILAPDETHCIASVRLNWDGSVLHCDNAAVCETRHIKYVLCAVEGVSLFSIVEILSASGTRRRINRQMTPRPHYKVELEEFEACVVIELNPLRTSEILECWRDMPAKTEMRPVAGKLAISLRNDSSLIYWKSNN